MPYSSASTVLQNAATATGNGTAVDVLNWDTFGVLFEDAASLNATITFEGSDDNTAWFAVPMQDTQGAVAESTATAGYYHPPVSHSYRYFRGRISAYASGNVTVRLTRRRRGSGG